MDIISIGIILVILVIVIIIIVRPLFSAPADNKADQSIDSLKAQYESVLTGIRDLESELQENKIENDIYAARKSDLINQAASLLKEIKDLEEKE